MKKTIFTTALLAGILSLAGCDKNEDNPGPGSDGVSDKAKEALIAKYPGATGVNWQSKGRYVVANFSTAEVRPEAPAGDYSAWFDNGGLWYMTETDIRFGQLPEAVKTAFQAGEYRDWRVDDVDRLEREGAERIYVIEVEGTENDRQAEYDLYYSEDGVLTKKVADAPDEYDYGDYIPSKPVSGVDNYLQTNYPDARILEVDYEGGMTEVEILDGNNGGYAVRELLFDGSGNWLYTKTEVRRHEVPAAVSRALEASEYASYYIDDIDHYLTADKEYYRYDLESRNGDVKVDITPAGELSVAEPGFRPGEGNGSLVSGTIAKFIADKYPRARILEQDYDNGLLEVEIWHENREKEVCFNGSGAWVYTQWDIRYNELPKAVTDAVAATQWASYHPDDAEFVQTSSGEYYLVELERGEREVTLRIDAQGRIL